MKTHIRVATALLAVLSMIAFSQAAFAEFGPPPPGITITPGGENCNGIVPTPGSENTVKTLTGLTVDATGTHAQYTIAYPVDISSVGDTFQIVDCVLSGSGSDLSTYTVLDEATFDGVVNSTSFNLTFTYTIPANTPIGTRICNVAKTTEGPSAPSASNRKAGPACFIVGGDARVEKHAAGDPNGPLLNGATFTVWDCNNTAIDPVLQPIIVTPAPSSGDIYSSTLAGGGVVHATAGTVAFSGPSGSTCNVTETSPPPGYELPPVADRTITITIPSGSSGATVYKFLDPLPPPNLTITKVADASPVNAGDPIGFVITVSNTGQGPATSVSMTDTLPTDPGLSWTIAGTTGSPTCSIASGVLTCTKASLAAGANFTVHITSPTTSASCGTVNNTATVSASNNDGSPQDSASVVVNCPTLAITKVADASAVNAGDPIGYTITVTNNGAGTASGVKLSDTLPSNSGLSWTVTSQSAGWNSTCAISSGVLTCGGANGVSLASGASLAVHISSPTTSATCPSVSNSASATSSNDGSPSVGPVVITVNCAALAITKVADASTVNAGEDIGYTITITNNGAGTASGVKLSDTLPSNAGLSWTVTSQSAGWNSTCAISAGVLTCGGANGVSLATGLSLAVHISSPTTSATCGTVANSASATTSNDGSPSVGPVVITVNCPNVTITKTADDSSVSGGDPIGFTITVTNAGPGTATGVKVSDTLPDNAGLDWTVTSQSAGWNDTCAIAAGVLTCGGANGVSLGVGSLSVHISSPTTADTCGSTVDNTATVTLTNGTGDEDSDSIDVVCLDLAINLTKDGPTLAHVGDTVTYTFTVTNGTAEPLQDVVLTDPICNSAPVLTGGDTGSDGILEQGETWTYTCSHVVTAGDPDPLPNTATVNATDKLGRPTSDEASHSVDIIHPAITIVKTVNPTSGNPGDTVTYTYVVKNTGDVTLTNVTVTDNKLGTIATGLTLDPGESVTLHKTAKLPSAAGLLVNVGTATGTDTLGKKVSANDNASVTIVLAVIILPKTGTSTQFPLETGFALLGIGFVLVAVARRRQHLIEAEIEGDDA